RSYPYGSCILNFPWSTDSKKRFDYGCYHHKENTAPEPGSGYLSRIGISIVPFLEYLDRSDEPQECTDTVHELGTGTKITPYLGICRFDSGISILSKADSRHQRIDSLHHCSCPQVQPCGRDMDHFYSLFPETNNFLCY